MSLVKTEREIKYFIDKRQAVTQRELSIFMYGNIKHRGVKLFKKWWDYVLKTKDWDKQREYTLSKINRDKDSKKLLIDKLIKKDKRLENIGNRKLFRYLTEVYKMQISRQTVIYYLRRKNEKVSN